MVDPRLLDKNWRIEHLYSIVDRNLKRIQFKKNRAQSDFENNKHNFNIILKSRRLGFTTFECVDMIDDTLFTRNFTGLFIAHTQNAAIEIFDKKILKNPGKMSHEKAVDMAEQEYRKYQEKTLSPVEKEYLENIKALRKKVEKKTKSV